MRFWFNTTTRLINEDTYIGHIHPPLSVNEEKLKIFSGKSDAEENVLVEDRITPERLIRE